MAPHNQSLAQLRYRLTSRGRRDRKYLLFSLPLQVQPPNVQLKLLHTNSQATPLVVHKPLANGSPVGVLPLPPRATKTILINLTAGPPIQGQRSLDLVGLPSRILKSLPAICSIRCTRRLVMVVPQNRTVLTLLR